MARRIAKKCSVASCGGRSDARGWCGKHYQRWRAHGDPLVNLTRRGEWQGACLDCDRRDVVFHGASRKCVSCARPTRQAWRRNTPEGREWTRQASIRAHRRHRSAVLDHYGRRCRCCGETNEAFLVIDHIDGGGNAHRRQLGKGKIAGSRLFYGWLHRNGFPPGFQVLCHNCNFAKSHHPGGCPHQTRSVAA
mgnify:CR=1 FL=1